MLLIGLIIGFVIGYAIGRRTQTQISKHDGVTQVQIWKER